MASDPKVALHAQQKIQRRKLLQRMAIGITIVILIPVIYNLIQVLTQDPDDRPPIIVTSGSVVFDAGKHPTTGERGNWKKDFGWGNTWRIDHAGTSPKTMLIDTLVGSSACANQSYDGIKSAELTYREWNKDTGATTNSKTLKIKVSGAFGKHIKVDFEDDPVPSGDHVLTIPNPVGINEWRIEKLVMAPSSQECTFDGAPRGFTIHHKK